MRFILLSALFSAAMSLNGCTVEKGPDGQPIPEAKKPPSPQVGEPLLIPQLPFVIVPLYGDAALEFPNAGGFSISKTGGVAYWAGSFGFFDARPAFWTNAIIYDKRSRQSHLLLDRKALVREAFVPKAGAGALGLMLLAVIDHDTNGDGSLDDKDACGLFALTAEGNLIRLTPPGTQFRSAVQDPNDFALFVRARTDPARSGKFADDNVAEYRVDLREPTEGAPLWDESLRAKAAAAGLSSGTATQP